MFYLKIFGMAVLFFSAYVVCSSLMDYFKRIAAQKAMEREVLPDFAYIPEDIVVADIWKAVLSVHDSANRKFLAALPNEAQVGFQKLVPLPVFWVTTTLTSEDDRKRLEILVEEIFRAWIIRLNRPYEPISCKWVDGYFEEGVSLSKLRIDYALTWKERKVLSAANEIKSKQRVRNAASMLRPIVDSALEEEMK